MFTGIISDVGVVTDVSDPSDRRFVIKTGYDTVGIEIGASIACSGVCLTVVETGPDTFVMEASAETLSLTTAGDWGVGTRLNNERALKLGDELGGHLVSGHVDGLAELVDLREENGSHRLTFEAPVDLAGFIARKGSVALDGVSLTVNDVSGTRFGVNIIPHTWSVTTLGERKVGDKLNMEVDQLARYVARLAEYNAANTGAEPSE